ncbi:RhbF-like rhizobactin siderophore biosynthesis protein, partial [Actinoplanes sp. TBRC 11911]|uniref:IucA/IucC family protein n=1 Tax=Actinoplanes sp. TBRC 11911 TaxID=2729386 RepID=UPI0017B5E7C9
MTRSLSPARLAEATLAEQAPHLVPGFLASLPAAADNVGRKLRGALTREGIRDMGPGVRHGFGRVEYPSSGAGDPVELLGESGIDAPGFAAELRDAVMNLAIAMARPVPAVGNDPDWQAIGLERLAVAGHNLHPCGRTRLGWSTEDVLAYDLETETTKLGFVAVP